MRQQTPECFGLSAALICFAAMLPLCVLHASPSQSSTVVELSPMPLDRTQAVPSLAMLGLNSNVLAAGSLAFEGGYDPSDWSGILKAAALGDDGLPGKIVWDAGAMLSDPALTRPDARVILTARKNDAGDISGMAFEPSSDFDEREQRGLLASSPSSYLAELAERVAYLRGVRDGESSGRMHVRGSLLGAITDTQTVYVAYPSGGYADHWPSKVRSVPVPAPEMQPGAQTYAQFLDQNANRPAALYLAANDGMLHVFHAPVPHCTGQDSNAACTSYDPGPDAGKEWWAYVPRAVYDRFGDMVSADRFRFEPTVDATPVTRDVFFNGNGAHEWHTLLVGGLRLGGRGVYALDITHPGEVNETFPQHTVLWEFDADASPGIAADGNAYNPADLGFTYGQPAIARLANGQWAVLIPNGYFPDCSQDDKPDHCEEVARSAPAGYSALFVLNAQTGVVLAELKTPTSIVGVTSHGLTTPVLGDYANDQIDDVAFAGDLDGNVWRFDLSSPNPAHWSITLAYRPTEPGAQPITAMPRLFPDPVTHRFIVLFGTGKYLGAGDKINQGLPVQSIYGIRDRLDGDARPITITHDSLQEQTLSQSESSDAGGAQVRSLTSHPVSIKAGGWYFDLKVIQGERVIATPAAMFDTNTALVSTFVPDGDAPYGAVMAVDAATGAPGSAFSFAGHSYAGALVEQPRATGVLPIITRVGGGESLLPGVSLKGSDKRGVGMPPSFASPIWRRRSWSLLTPGS